jgi:hypothetical protein
VYGPVGDGSEFCLEMTSANSVSKGRHNCGGSDLRVLN